MTNKFAPALERALVAALFCLVWAGFAQASPSFGSQRSEPRVALVIGNSSYAESPLKTPKNDAQLIAKSLESLGFRVMLRLDAKRAEMKSAIDDFGRELDQGGVGLFYFAGHGVQVGGRNYLIPIGANISGEADVAIESVDVARVLVKMDTSKSRINLVILDACRSNPLARSFRAQDQGLAFVNPPQGTLIAYATAPGQVVPDISGDNSLYTAVVAKEAQRVAVPVEHVFKRVRADVRDETSGRQVPWESSSLEGDFFFRWSEPEQPPPAAVPTCSDSQVAVDGACQPTADSATPAELPSEAPKPSANPPAADPTGRADLIPADLLGLPQDNALPPEHDARPAGPSSGSTQRTLGVVSIGVGGAAVMMGLVTKLLSTELETRLEAGCNGGICPDSMQADIDDYNTYKALNVTGYVAGAGLGVLGIVLIATAPDGETESAQVQPYVTATGGGVRGAF